MKNSILITIALLSFLFSQNASGQKNEQSAPKKPLLISCGVCNQKVVNLPQPEYPKAALAVNASGTVSVSIIIGEKGDVIEAEAVSGHPLLQPAAIKAAMQSKFSPAFISGKAIQVRSYINYRFVPKGSNQIELKENSEPNLFEKSKHEIKPISILIGKPIKLLKPSFPPNCRCKFSKNLRVEVQFIVNEKGNVESVKAISGHPLLKQVSEMAIRASTFNSSSVALQSVKAYGKIVYDFVSMKNRMISRIIKYKLKLRKIN